MSTIDFGIDLGTTNSSVAVCRRGEVRIFQTTELMNVTPSVVYVSKTGRKLVGRKAYDNWVQDPANTHAEFKRWMGYSDKMTFPASGESFTAEQLSAEILKSVRADAERQSGEKLDAAVITVPAAFGSLQCEATGRAAKLAGIEQAPLLQEPIAAAVAYGASPASRDQRWMVFDLGGGTLDIAIVSTRNGQLAVLEHQGNNRLGGKDIDRVIAEAFLLEPLRSSFKLPDAQEQPEAFSRLMRALVRSAEQAKIALSSADAVPVELFDIGDDLAGTPIEATFTLRRSEVDAKVMPVVDKCLELARRALDLARITGKDLDRVLLVGGPTQTPLVRAALVDALGAKLDYSLDPMTVVAHGAALYASTQLRDSPASATRATSASVPTAAAGVKIQLAFERASGTLQSPVAGIVPDNARIKEVRIDSASGIWTSGWLPVVGGTFQVDVHLNENKPVTSFRLTARAANGDPILVDPPNFEIAYMLPMAAPPLPHTIAIELTSATGEVTFDPIFKRHCPLPAEVRRTYRTERTLRPSDLDASLPIKFWEIEVSDDPQERWWAGSVHVNAEWIKRPIPEGTDIDLTISIDASRKLSVDLFIPLLSESLKHDVYVPDPPSARSQLQKAIDLCFDRLHRLRIKIFASDLDELFPKFERLQERAETIAEQLSTHDGRDPDAALNPTESIRTLRVQLTQLEEQAGVDGGTMEKEEVQARVRWYGRVIEDHGTELEKQQFTKLHEQYVKYLETESARGAKWAVTQMYLLFRACVHDQSWYWQNQLAALRSPGNYRFANQDRARELLSQAPEVMQRQNVAEMRGLVHRLWDLVAPDELERAKEQEAVSGLRSL